MPHEQPLDPTLPHDLLLHLDQISAQDTLTIGESAVVTAQIVGNSVVIHGRVTGDVTAKTAIGLYKIVVGQLDRRTRRITFALRPP